MSRPSATPFTIRRRLAGLSNEDVGRLLNMTPDRAGELLGERGAFAELSELRCELRTALNKGPDLRVVYRELLEHELVPGRAGRNVRWTRIVLDSTLCEWGREIGKSGGWWSKFERDEALAERCLARGSLSEDQIMMISLDMELAGKRLAELFPSAALPLLQGHDRAASTGTVSKLVVDADRRVTSIEVEKEIVRPHGRRIAGRAE
jgi:hypothetical protein